MVGFSNIHFHFHLETMFIISLYSYFLLVVYFFFASFSIPRPGLTTKRPQLDVKNCKENHPKKCVYTGNRNFNKNTKDSFTNDSPQRYNNDCMKGSIRSLPKKNAVNFKMALPSFNNATLEKIDDIWLEIPTKVLNAFPVNKESQVTIGVFWFTHHTLFPVEENNTKLLNSRVVGIDVGEDVSGLPDYVNLTFLFQNASLVNKTVKCVFWDADNGTAHWNTSGCFTEQRQNDTVCSCNHLSFFAILLAPGIVSVETVQSGSLSSSSVWLLTLLSKAGCGISLFFLCLAVLIYLRRGTSNDSLNIHMHLCVALLCLNLTFLINDSLTSLGIPWLCVAIAAVTHYSLLCTLTWFSLESFHLYMLIIRVFNIYIHRYLLKLGLVGWGTPGIVVIIIVACGKYGEYNLNLKDGGVVKMCWITDSVLMTVSYSYFVLTFAVNLLCYVSMTVKVVMTNRRTPDLKKKSISWRTVLCLLGLAWLLGISWGVQLFQFGPLTETVLYIFCIFNSLHGFFLCLHYWALTQPDKTSCSTVSTTVSSTDINSDAALKHH
ncbi:hypothetical protein UPYG_G00081560 [Umbra pygmaea]|uniref:Uncharacterized protein n=1 Tax=Umbra pygmaea TaxID=75934 RepID=A0ABD0XT86_UMBPY